MLSPPPYRARQCLRHTTNIPIRLVPTPREGQERGNARVFVPCRNTAHDNGVLTQVKCSKTPREHW